MKKISILLASLVLFLVGCQANQDSATDEDLREVTIVLDYVPNTNHTGLYMALEKGYYEDEGLDVTIIEPGTDTTSIQTVAAGNAEFAVTYQEDLTYAQANQGIGMKAIATIIKENTSGFVSLADSGIESPADFEGKVYAGWQSPAEEAIIRETMRAYGADPDEITIVGDTGEGPLGLGSSYDIQWYFEAWDNVKAEMEGIDLNYMPLRELDDRLNYYTPIIAARGETIDNDSEMVAAFMRATKKAYQEAMEDPQAAGEFMADIIPEYDADFVKRSQEVVSGLYTDDPEAWGLMEESVWTAYTNFMLDNNLIQQGIPSENLFTNQFVEVN